MADAGLAARPFSLLSLRAAGQIAAVAISFGVSLWFITAEPDQVFSLLPFRAWELLLGGILAAGVIRPIRRTILANVIAATSFALIAYAVVAF